MVLPPIEVLTGTPVIDGPTCKFSSRENGIAKAQVQSEGAVQIIGRSAMDPEIEGFEIRAPCIADGAVVILLLGISDLSPQQSSSEQIESLHPIFDQKGHIDVIHPQVVGSIIPFFRVRGLPGSFLGEEELEFQGDPIGNGTGNEEAASGAELVEAPQVITGYLTGVQPPCNTGFEGTLLTCSCWKAKGRGSVPSIRMDEQKKKEKERLTEKTERLRATPSQWPVEPLRSLYHKHRQ